MAWRSGNGGRRRWLALPALAALLVCAIVPARGGRLLVRVVDEKDGLEVGVRGLAQDATGFIWVGTTAGLRRWDGVTLRRVAPEQIEQEIYEIAPLPGGRLAVLEAHHDRVWLVDGEEAHVLRDAGGAAVGPVRHIHADRSGELWLLLGDGRLRRRDTRGAWHDVDLGGARGHTFGRARSGPPLVATDRGVVRVQSGDRVVPVSDVRHAIVLAERDDGLLVLGLSEPMGRFLALREGRTVGSFDAESLRPAAIAFRGEDVWISCDHGAFRWRPPAAPERFDRRDLGARLGALLVDREQGVWFGSSLGLVHVPRPGMRLWGVDEGLPVTDPRHLAWTASGLWIGTWLHPARFDPRTGRFEVRDDVVSSRQICADRHGVAWMTARRRVASGRAVDGIVAFDGDDVRFQPAPGRPGGCASASDGRVVLLAGDGVYRTASRGAPASRLGALSPAGCAAPYLRAVARGRLWASCGPQVCSAQLEPSPAGGWDCETLDDALEAFDVLEVAPGTLWVATRRGVFRHTDSGWTRLPSSLREPTPSFFRLAVSPRGGAWVAGHQQAVRAVPTGGDWRVVERLPGSIPRAGNVLERPDGTLWVASPRGLMRVPADERGGHGPPPPPRVVGLSHDGRPLDAFRRVTLPAGEARLEVTLSTLSYRAPDLLRYRYRLRDDAPWITTRRPLVRLAGLGPGRYRLSFGASWDGTHWSTSAHALEVTVTPPPWATWWAFSGYAIALLLASWAVHRVRLALALARERERTRIAMDLHDELGAGLGSIGLLSSLLGEETEPASRRRIAAEIAETSGELGASVADIVWSLRGRSSSLAALGRFLVERAGRLLPPETRLEVRHPDPWPDIRLSLAVRRELQWIAVEALHNVARHAGPCRVVLAFEPAGGRRWQMMVEDDGRGLPDGARDAEIGGFGLESMRRRARAIGAELELGPGTRGGMRVVVTFDPRARHTA
ncbi:MAG: hypothetical protein Kow0062_00590 [Acidobacteriota bacterium]